MAEEYHIGLTADGYLDGEIFLGQIEAQTNLSDIVIEMTRSGTDEARNRLTRVVGTVTRDGEPIAEGGRVGAWQKRRREMDRVNAAIRRGRTVPMPGYEPGWSRVEADGSFAVEDLAIDPRWGPWFFVYEGLDGASAVVGPVTIDRDDREVNVDIALSEQSSIGGTVEHVPGAMAGQVWVVLFDGGVIRRETLAKPDGSFRFEGLPPGRYGLKAGHDGSKDPHVPVINRDDPDPTLWQKPAEPWQGAEVVTLEPGESAEGITLDARPPGPIVEAEAEAGPQGGGPGR